MQSSTLLEVLQQDPQLQGGLRDISGGGQLADSLRRASATLIGRTLPVTVTNVRPAASYASWLPPCCLLAAFMLPPGCPL